MVFCVSPESNSSTFPDAGFNLASPEAKHLHGGTRSCLFPHDDDEGAAIQQQTAPSEALIAEALQSLSLEDREKVFDEIHGVDTHIEEAIDLETPSFLEKQLHFFEEELQLFKLMKQGNAELNALALAERQNLTFVQDSRLRLAFLRTRTWDVSEAVGAFVRYFDYKLYLFGARLLTKYISVNDLSPKEMNDLSQGYIQILPNRDRAGRVIYFWLNVGQEYDSPEALARQIFLMIPTDLDTQRRGLTMVSIRMIPFKFKNTPTLEALAGLSRLATDLPFRYAAQHTCLPKAAEPSPTLSSFVQGLVPVFSEENKARMRFHYGTYMEWCYELLTYGIPVHLLPITSDLKIKSKNHREFLDMMSRATTSCNKIDAILSPTNRDLLLGKGKPIQQSPGNVIWSEFLEVLVSCNNSNLSTPMVYTDLAKQVVEKVHQYRGRILTKDSGVWEVVPDEVAYDKIASMMRNRRFRRKHQDVQRGPLLDMLR
eukprot:Nitzschia sp. Nitz4//scaffold90_size81538//64531//66156//NITZ4_005327-RA/size81538-augustus-gene-0.8-mRNA-1//1//CDS//3329560035//9008//frame0